MIPRLALALVGGAFAIACSVPGEPAGTSPRVTQVPNDQKPLLSDKEFQDSNVNVTRLYEDNCSHCHGKNAQGGGAGTKSLINVDKFDQKWDVPFFNIIKKGDANVGMDAFGKTHSDAEVWSLVVHIRELQNAGLRRQGWGPKESGGVYTSQHGKYKEEVVVERSQGLRLPWCLSFLPDGRMLVSNRSGTLNVIRRGVKVGEVTNLPKSMELGQGGLMDVVPHPDYSKNGWLYIAVADPKKDGSGKALTKIVRGKLQWDSQGSAKFISQQTIFEAPQKFYTGAGIHFGGKIAFDGKGHVLFSVGERGSNMGQQNLDVPWGKIHRLNDDGTVPSDNPYKDSPFPSTWTWGHRNPQGLAFGLDGQLWDAEHGPRGGDEFNKLEKGKNYGWPILCFGINYNDSPFMVPWPRADQNLTLPVLRWLPSIATSGLACCDGKMFPGWKGDFFVGGQAGQTVRRLRVRDGKVVEQEEIIFGQARTRDVRFGPDGALYVVQNDPDRIVRITPVK